MVTKELLEYIQKGRAGGLKDKELETKLRNAGWDSKDVREALLKASVQKKRGGEEEDAVRADFSQAVQPLPVTVVDLSNKISFPLVIQEKTRWGIALLTTVLFIIGIVLFFIYGT